MLRITVISTDENTVRFKLEGSISGPWIEEIRKVWESTIKSSTGLSYVVDLDGVSFIGDGGTELLRELSEAGASFRGGGLSTRYIAQEVKKALG